MEHRLVARNGHLTAAFQVVLLGGAVPIALTSAAVRAGSAGVRVSAIVGIGASLAAAWWLIRGALGASPALHVDPAGLTIVHPRLLREAFRIDRTNVRAVRICRGAAGLPFTANVQRFPWPDGPGSGRRWAFDFKNGSLFPTVTAVAAAPTVLIVLRDPVRLPVRRLLPRRLVRPGLQLPGRDAVGGVMLCVRRPDGLEPAVGTWGDPGIAAAPSLAS